MSYKELQLQASQNCKYLMQYLFILLLFFLQLQEKDILSYFNQYVQGQIKF